MRSAWWGLPGPSALLDAVESDLCEGRHVVVALPSTMMDPTFLDAVKQRVHRAELRFTRWHLDEDDPDIMGALARAASIPVSLERPPTAQDIASSPAFSGQAVVVSLSSTPAWSRVQDVLAELAQVNRARDSFERGVLCAIVAGDAARALPAEDVTLSVRAWRDVTDQLDMSLWAASLLRGAARGALRKRLDIARVTELAGGDPWVAERLLGDRLQGLEAAMETLVGYGQERGWSADVTPTWEHGSIHHVGGSRDVHASVIAVRGDRREISRRLWAAQVTVVFPRLEAERMAMVDSHRALLRVPFDTPWGAIQHAEQLELAHLRHQLGRRVSGNTIRRLDDLVAARNALAHLELVAPAILDRIFPDAHG